MLRFAEFLLLFDDKGISIFEGILGPPLKGVNNLRPLLFPVIPIDQRQHQDILLYLPRPLLDLRVQVAIPVLSALLGTPEYFALLAVCLILSLGHILPVDEVQVAVRLGQLLLHHPSQQ